MLIYCSIVWIACRFLDLSFNHIGDIKNLDALHQLNKLFLIQNKISVISNLTGLTNLTTLELGSNRIRVCDSIVCNYDYAMKTIQ